MSGRPAPAQESGIGGKGIPGSAVGMGKGTEVGKQRACVRSSHGFCLAGEKGLWREQREIRLEGLVCQGKRRGEG